MCPFFLQVVCEQSEVLASGCGVSRAFPLYSRKTHKSPAPSPQTISVGFIVVGEKASPVTEKDVECLTAHCEGMTSSVGTRNRCGFVLPRNTIGSGDS